MDAPYAYSVNASTDMLCAEANNQALFPQHLCSADRNSCCLTEVKVDAARLRQCRTNMFAWELISCDWLEEGSAVLLSNTKPATNIAEMLPIYLPPMREESFTLTSTRS